ncbi:MAG: hypothetical protein ACREE0_22335 [Phenylobacterium sp.]
MLDINGRLIRLGDRIDIGSAEKGVVVVSVDTDEFAEDFPEADWQHELGKGIMVRMDGGALVSLASPDEHTEVLNPD